MKALKGCVLAVFAIIGLSLIVVVGGYLWFQFSIVEPYKAFRVIEQQIVPQLDALNEAAAKTLPNLPPDALENERWSVGIINPIYDHGRWLIISVSTPMTTEEIATYYRENLIPAGWSEYSGPYSHDFDLYIRGTGCLQIHFLTERLDSYDITIWHDFRSQSFSPPLPNLDYMQFTEYGETNFATCPPQ